MDCYITEESLDKIRTENSFLFSFLFFELENIRKIKTNIQIRLLKRIRNKDSLEA